jgi:predicted restriction endonuclease
MPHAQADDYNTYHRSPRIIHREPTDDIKIERPPLHVASLVLSELMTMPLYSDSIYLNHQLVLRAISLQHKYDHQCKLCSLEVQADGLNILSQNTVASSLIRLTQEMPHAQADDYS